MNKKATVFFSAVVLILITYQNCAQQSFDSTPAQGPENSVLGNGNGNVNPIPPGGGSGGPFPPVVNPPIPVDPACPGAAGERNFIPFASLVSPDVSTDCANGIEVNNLIGDVYEMDVTHVMPLRKAWIDYATYTVSDSIMIYGEDGSGNKTTLFSQCRIATSNYGFFEAVRPPNDSIRQFQFNIPAGTQKLIFDFSKTDSPFYIRMQGLCDFNRSHDIVLKQGSTTYRHQFRLYPEGTVIF